MMRRGQRDTREVRRLIARYREPGVMIRVCQYTAGDLFVVRWHPSAYKRLACVERAAEKGGRR